MQRDKHQENIKKITDRINSLKREKTPLVIAIDGRCAAGKSTLAEDLQNAFLCNMFHMDDFYLQTHQRTKERYDEPGGNVDRERFLDEVLIKLTENKPFSYRPFDCKSMTLAKPVEVMPNDINIIEGSYSLHPLLKDYYDLTIFLTIDREIQLQRLKKRNPDKLDMFKERWIPLEEKYFDTFNIENNCDIVISG